MINKTEILGVEGVHMGYLRNRDKKFRALFSHLKFTPNNDYQDILKLRAVALPENKEAELASRVSEMMQDYVQKLGFQIEGQWGTYYGTVDLLLNNPLLSPEDQYNSLILQVDAKKDVLRATMHCHSGEKNHRILLFEDILEKAYLNGKGAAPILERKAKEMLIAPIDKTMMIFKDFQRIYECLGDDDTSREKEIEHLSEIKRASETLLEENKTAAEFLSYNYRGRVQNIADKI